MTYTKFLFIVALIAGVDHAYALFVGAGAGAGALAGGFAGAGMFGPRIPFGFPNLPQPPQLPWFGTIIPFPFFPIPNPADIANFNTNGVTFMTSTNTASRDADGKPMTTGGTTIVTNEDGVFKVVKLGDNPPEVKTQTVELKPGTQEAADNLSNIPQVLPLPWFGSLVPFPIISIPSPADIINMKPSPDSNVNGVALISSKTIGRDAEGKPVSTGGTTILSNNNGEVTALKLGDNPPELTTESVPSTTVPLASQLPKSANVGIPANPQLLPAIANIRRGPNSNYNGMAVTSTITSGVGPNGQIIKTDGGTVMTNSNGETRKIIYGENSQSGSPNSIHTNRVSR